MAWKVLFFQTARGDYPVKEFMEELDEATYAKILHSIELLENHGPFLKPPYSKKLIDKAYELRISGSVAVRILYTYTVFNNEFYLLHAFKKKTQKTPRKELKTALDIIKEII